MDWKLQKERKKKITWGQSGSALKLQRLSSVPLEGLAEMANIDAFLSNSCENQLTSIANLEKKLGEVKAGTVERLSKLHLVSSIVTLTDSRKRLDDSGDGSPTLASEEQSELKSPVLKSRVKLKHHLD